jgi:hypothetical protein
MGLSEVWAFIHLFLLVFEYHIFLFYFLFLLYENITIKKNLIFIIYKKSNIH